MSPVDYVIDILLIALVLRQIRRQPLTAGSIILPAVLIIAAGLNYLRPFRIGGNDLALIDAADGSRHCAGHAQRTRDSSLARQRRDHSLRRGSPPRCSGLSAWLDGFGFAYYSTHGGRNEVAQFSIAHHITGDAVWMTALVLMAFGEVLARVLVLQIRRVRQSAGERLRANLRAVRPLLITPYASAS